ncbi:MAG: PepSY domain-containing protein [Paraburkholderia sp.]|uniref:PepSY domain-containing protein n=1 Tax=Paraburkholderia sp. TaxID=1926495 RepID=UPI0012049A16|nr:PepSY domain-containing protein [Paraburkholderia sp.]TAM05678.1 MAG: PepSY domain-containing protein [Paraburkholderia sp.]
MNHSRLAKGFALALLVLTGALFVVAASPLIRSALAGERCNAPLADWKSRDAVYALAQQKGWRIDRLKVDDGCYQLKGYDTDGRRFKARLDPATLDVLRLKRDDGDEHGPGGEREDRGAAPDGTTTGNAVDSTVGAPPGGLLTPGSKPSVQIR